jgi:3-oxoacyl-[acyl-carrier-protein] synthase II
MKRRVVVTGMGIVSPLGQSVAESWDKVAAGNSAVGPIESEDLFLLPVKIGGQVTDFNALEYIDNPRTLKLLVRPVRFGAAAAHLAYVDSGLKGDHIDHSHFGVFVGTGGSYGGHKEIEAMIRYSLSEDGRFDLSKFGREAKRAVNPLWLLSALTNICQYYITMRYEAFGVNNNICMPGVAGAVAIGEGFRAIQNGALDVALTGAYDSLINLKDIIGLASLGLLANDVDDPTKACRPFDRKRSGTVVGEGGGFLVLEDYSHALKRGAEISCEIVGYGQSCEAHSVVSTRVDGKGWSMSLMNAIKDAKVGKEEIDLISSHGSGTMNNDISETNGAKAVFGGQAYRIPMNSIKPILGHTMAASGCMELIMTIMSLRTNVIAPTINLEDDDPRCDLDYIPLKPREASIGCAVSVTRGMGGNNAAIIVRKLGG